MQRPGGLEPSMLNVALLGIRFDEGSISDFIQSIILGQSSAQMSVRHSEQ